MRDWTGNTKSLFTTNGDSSHSDKERESNDFYATDPKAVEQLCDLVPLNHEIWEPACGMGHISKVLAARGHHVRSTDLIDRGFGEGGVDFLMQNTPPHGRHRHQSAVQACEGVRGTRIGASAKRQQTLHVPQTYISRRSEKAGTFSETSAEMDLRRSPQVGMPDERRVQAGGWFGGLLCLVRLGERVQGQARNRMVQLGVQAVEDSMAEK